MARNGHSVLLEFAKDIKTIFVNEGWSDPTINDFSNRIENCKSGTEYNIWTRHPLPNSKANFCINLEFGKNIDSLVHALSEKANHFFNLGMQIQKVLEENAGELPLVQTGDTRDAFEDSIEDAFVAERILKDLATKVDTYYRHVVADREYIFHAFGNQPYTLDKLKELYEKLVDKKKYPDFIEWFHCIQKEHLITPVQTDEEKAYKIIELHQSMRGLNGGEYSYSGLQDLFEKLIKDSNHQNFDDWLADALLSGKITLK